MGVLWPNEWQLRLGWIRAIVALVNGGAPVKALGERLQVFEEEQDGWLTDISPPHGRLSRRSSRPLVQMAEAYGVLSLEEERLTGRGRVLAALDDWEPGASTHPFSWSPSLGLYGLRLCVESNGVVLLPLLKRWGTMDDVADLLKSVYVEHLKSDDARGREAAQSALVRLDGTNAKRSVLRPVLEPLRDLGLVKTDDGSYVLTTAGERLRTALAECSSAEVWLTKQLVTSWRMSQGMQVDEASARLLAERVPSLLADLPASLRGHEPESAPVVTLVPWLQSKLLEAKSPVCLEREGFTRWIQGVATRSKGKIYLRSGLRRGQPDLCWHAGTLKDPLFWIGEIPAPTTLELPLNAAPQTATVVAGDGKTAPARPPIERPAKPPSSRVRAWHAWVRELLMGDDGPLHGGPETWLHHLESDLVDVSSERLENRRRESGLQSDFDNGSDNTKHLMKVFCGPLREGIRLLSGEPCIGPFRSLYGHALEEKRPAAKDLALIQLARERLPKLKEVARVQIAAFLRGEAPAHAAEAFALRGERALRLSRWLVEDAMYWHGREREELAAVLGDEASEERALRFIEELSLLKPLGWYITYSIKPRSNDDSIIIRDALVAIEPEKTVSPIGGTSLTWEAEVSAPSKASAQAEAKRSLDSVAARLDFCLRTKRLASSGLPVGAFSFTAGLSVQAVDFQVDETSSLSPQEEAQPMWWGVRAPVHERRLRENIPTQIARTLMMLRRDEHGEGRWAQRVANLWVAMEHLVVDDNQAKRGEVIRAVSNAAALLMLPARAGRVLRAALASLHRVTFETSKKERALARWSAWISEGERERYSAVAHKIQAPREKFFGAGGVLELSDKDALIRLATHAVSANEESKRTDKESKRTEAVELAELIAEDAPLTSWRLGILAHHLESQANFRALYRETRLHIASLLHRSYAVRNRLVHAGDMGSRRQDADLEALYRRLRRCVDHVTLALLQERFDGVAVSVRWAMFEHAGASLLGREREELVYPQPLLESELIDT